MKIKEIKLKENSFNIYQVTLEPNWLEKLFGVKEKIVEYKDTGKYYTYGSGAVYVDRLGNQLGNGHRFGDAIDKFRRSW